MLDASFLILVLYGYILGECYGDNILECGITNAVKYHNLANSQGWDKPPIFPWHATIFKVINSTEPPKYACIGTIVSQKAIVSVASCFFYHSTCGTDDSTFFVAVGKSDRSWDRQSPLEQRFKVTQIDMHETYGGHDNWHVNNIAILALNKSIIFSSAVMPICIDWSLDDKPDEVLVDGSVTSWFPSEIVKHKEIDDVIMKIDYFQFEPCSTMWPLDTFLEEFMLYDMFCGRPKEDSSIFSSSYANWFLPYLGGKFESSGGGFVLPKNTTNTIQQYYFYGILSFRSKKYKTDGITDIRKYLTWLKSTIEVVKDRQVFVSGYDDSFKECGNRYAVNHHVPAISYGYEAKNLEFPWHVGIYRQFNSSQRPEYICGGSIIYQKLILTAAHCVYKEDTFDISNAIYIVAVGKFYSSWDYRGPFEQRFKVINITVPEKYRGLTNRYANDIGVLTLNETIRFSSLVMPICIDWNFGLNHTFFNTGTVVGWGNTENGTLSRTLLIANLTYYNFTICREKLYNEGFSDFVTSDKFCAGLDNGTSADRGDSGGSIVSLRNSNDNKDRYYLQGIVSVRDTFGSNITAFTDLSTHLMWLNRTISSFINPGYCLPLYSDKVELVLCNFNGTLVDCNKPARPGTIAKVQCKSTFHKGFPFELYMNTVCLKNQTWSPLMDLCMDCGKRYRFNDFVPSVSYKPRTASEYPWHVALYKKNDTQKEEYIYICGGTIIHPKAVVTSAVCIFKTSREDNINMIEIVNEPNRYYAVVGKYKSEWNIRDSFEQRFQISNIYLKETFIGIQSRYANDIAVLELNSTIDFSDYIMPACVDWKGALDLHKKSYTFGLFPGWGITETGNSSSELRVARLIFLDWRRCRRDFDGHVTFISADKFCATSDDGSSTENGDDGGSLAFPKYNEKTGESRYYLYGVMSSKSLYENVVACTNFTVHLKWIKKIMASIIKKMK